MNINTNDLLIGGDPEFFAYDTKKKEYISLIPYISGTKDNPNPLPINGCFDLIDNTSIEFNLPPVPEFWMLHSIINDCIKYTNKWLKNINPDYKLIPVSAARFNDDQLTDLAANLFGCDPAYSIYNGTDSVPRPEPSELNGLRTASYHIHYGFDEEISIDNIKDFIFLNDLFLGFPAIFLDKEDSIRKKVYGNFGEHRIKTSNNIDYELITDSNRVEYRVLGAGIHNSGGFINDAIIKIKDNLNHVDSLKEDFYTYLESLYYDYNMTLINEIKNKILSNKLIKNFI